MHKVEEVHDFNDLTSPLCKPSGLTGYVAKLAVMSFRKFQIFMSMPFIARDIGARMWATP